MPVPVRRVSPACPPSGFGLVCSRYGSEYSHSSFAAPAAVAFLSAGDHPCPFGCTPSRTRLDDFGNYPPGHAGDQHALQSR